jgi:hypothetical protein
LLRVGTELAETRSGSFLLCLAFEVRQTPIRPRHAGADQSTGVRGDIGGRDALSATTSTPQEGCSTMEWFGASLRRYQH